ncbi:WYL domain-containing protein [uncultured Mailhella sp.]|uniref:helix-turn-helix transcriptional regulator n=1 Tax=uncultured Mailhella sp. TaxID=1981031 RepID=UPI0026231796|nr:WYL domain-containing protein [uncultured Mailhella sp.]
MSATEKRPQSSAQEDSRISRLLRIVQAIREDPHQKLDSLLSKLCIGRSQFYKDRNALAEAGFQFGYSRSSGFRILEDRFAPLTDLNFSDRLILMFALEQLSATGDGTLAALAVTAGRKLAGGLPRPFQDQLLACFDREVTSNGFGVKPEVFSALHEAVAEGRRLRILYTRSGIWKQGWREIDPRHIYMQGRVLYVYGRTVDETPPQWKVFRVSRIERVQYTGMRVTWKPGEDGGFLERRNNAFGAFIGADPHWITIRFTGQASHYVAEQQWHPSQKLEKTADGDVLFSVNVADVHEVIRWAKQFGSEAEIVAVQQDGGQDGELNLDQDDAAGALDNTNNMSKYPFQVRK